ncbi:peptidoglycan DD-metalloendopeptidase family protein [Dongia soli]|uniref:Peptidoglycan DD-metalloendopeptidase family protein n=1 Tax=Dongia soli TaxID=600628 RepID=A0ABU5E856_9PROT|nr:peptidoglycan DD-metalloendopeptidase family protein [Dongia soli]MDY0882493.1 peptidoglycan DD-metalloendopeptidase family protein [Dongia soli]
MYTAAGFVALGGFGAVWSARPPLVDQVQASQFSGAKASTAFEQKVHTDPSWSQRLVNDLNERAFSTADPLTKPETIHRLANHMPSARDDRAAPEAQTASQAPISQTSAAQAQPASAPASTQLPSAPALRSPWSQPVTIKPAGTEAAKADMAKDGAATQTAAATPASIWAPIDSPRDDRAELPSLSIEELSSAFNLGSRPNPPRSWTNSGGGSQANNDTQRTVEIRRGETLFGVLVDAGIDYNEAQDAVGALSDVFSPRALQAGQEITLNLSDASASGDEDAAPKLVGLSFEPSVTKDVTLERSESGDFVAKAVDKPLDKQVTRVSGSIDSSLFEAGREAGLPVAVVSDVIKTFSYDVDFQRDIHGGDTFEVLYERYENEDGAFAKAGKMLYAALTLGGKKIPMYYFEHDGEGEFFTALGETVRKSLLRTPIDGARITSGFGMRMHPLLGYSKMHKGIDFGAPTGTPIFAAGAGVVVEVGQKNGYGNYVRIKHNVTYSTAYAHCSRFAAGLHKGDRVKQGEVIAYVGQTGRATGPHLHYEILVDNQQVNPSKVKIADSNKLTGRQLVAFKAQVEKVDAELAKQRRNTFIAETPGMGLDCAGPNGCEN